MFDKIESIGKTVPRPSVDYQLDRRIQDVKDVSVSTHYIKAAYAGATAVTMLVRAEQLRLHIHSPTYQTNVEITLERIEDPPITSNQLRQKVPRQIAA